MSAIDPRPLSARRLSQPSEDYVGVRIEPDRRHGRGAETNKSGRFEKLERAFVDDGWSSLDLLPPLSRSVG